jgi:hypothetical protein
MDIYCDCCAEWFCVDEEIECCPECGEPINYDPVDLSDELDSMFPEGIDDGFSIDCQPGD